MGTPFGRWGAPPQRHSAKDIRSGEGEQGNAMLFENVEKAVVRGTFCDFGTVKVMSPPTTATPPIYKAASALTMNPSIGALLRVLIAMFLGK